jgi:hypothetical protein
VTQVEESTYPQQNDQNGETDRAAMKETGAGTAPAVADEGDKFWIATA